MSSYTKKHRIKYHKNDLNLLPEIWSNIYSIVKLISIVKLNYWLIETQIKGSMFYPSEYKEFKKLIVKEDSRKDNHRFNNSFNESQYYQIEERIRNMRIKLLKRDIDIKDRLEWDLYASMLSTYDILELDKFGLKYKHIMVFYNKHNVRTLVRDLTDYKWKII